MKKVIIIFLFFITSSTAFGNMKNNIINNLVSTQNLSFDFEQNINGKIESGTCVMEYPKKIYCAYNLKNRKKLISNGKSLVIKTNSGSYYRYPISKTPLDYILDKKILIAEIKKSKKRIINDAFINFTIFKEGNEINIFFDKNNFNLIGWQTLDIYQNLNITFLSSIEKNQKLSKNLFKLPSQN